MKTDPKQLYLIGGVTLIVSSFFYVARAFGGIIALLLVTLSVDFDTTDQAFGTSMANMAIAKYLSGGVEGLISFMALFMGGRWMLKGPKLLDKWINETKAQNQMNGEKAAGENASRPTA